MIQSTTTASRFGKSVLRKVWLPLVMLAAGGSTFGQEFSFGHHFGDSDLPLTRMGQTDLADLDGDGDLDFTCGQAYGPLFWYERRSNDSWVMHPLGENSPSDVGGKAHDVNGDGRIDFVTGGAWYENPGDPANNMFRRHVFDAELSAVHDLLIGDINGDGKADVVTMADDNDLRWYDIPADPLEPWPHQQIAAGVHSGISLGDIDGDGDTDLARSDIWVENLAEGRRWKDHKVTEPFGRTDGKPFEVNAAQTRIADVNGDGRPDIVATDGESPGARILWIEAPEDPRGGAWKVHHLPRSDDVRLGALHSLVVADFNLDGHLDIFSVEMEGVGGDELPRWFIWAGDGTGTFTEHVILDEGLGGHEAVAGDVDGDGDLDICAKLWRPRRDNANGGRNHFSFMENLAIQQAKE